MRFPNDILQTLSQVMSTGFILYGKNPKLLGIMMLLSPAQMVVQVSSYVERHVSNQSSIEALALVVNVPICTSPRPPRVNTTDTAPPHPIPPAPHRPLAP
jgi:hypothetical protein